MIHVSKFSTDTDPGKRGDSQLDITKHPGKARHGEEEQRKDVGEDLQSVWCDY